MDIKGKMNSLSDSQKGLVKMLMIFMGVILVFIILLLVVKGLSGSKVTYAQLENIMTRAAERYVKADSSVIKSDVYGTTEISVNTLIEKKYMKKMTSYVGKKVTCDAKVLVYKNLDYYDYIPKLDCGKEYATVSLSNKITDESNIVTNSSGLYKETNGYVYRGEYVDNFVKFSGKLWRIISIDNDGNMKIIQMDKENYSPWDNRYNSNYGYTSGINDFEGVEASRLKNAILESYNNVGTITTNAKALVIPKQYCIGKRSKDDASKDGSTECATTSELMGATGLTVAEYLNASLDSGCTTLASKECANYNYLAKLQSTFWTVTAQKENSGYAYYVSSKIQIAQASSSYNVKIVVTINGDINYVSGDGTEGNPYIVE